MKAPTRLDRLRAMREAHYAKAKKVKAPKARAKVVKLKVKR